MSHSWICKQCGNRIGNDYSKCPMCDPVKEKVEALSQFDLSLRDFRKESTKRIGSRNQRQKQPWGWHIDKGYSKK